MYKKTSNFIVIFFLIRFITIADSSAVEVKIKYKKSNRLEFIFFRFHENNKNSETNLFSNLHGKYKEFYFDEKLRVDGTYSNNIKVGEWKTYYKNGKIKSLENFNKYGMKDGLFEEYYFDGQLAAKGLYIEEKKVGNWYLYTFNKRKNGFDEKVIHYPSLSEYFALDKSKLLENIKISPEGKLLAILYPEIELMHGVEGQAIFTYFVDSTCKIRNFKMINSLSHTIDTLCKLAEMKLLLYKKEKNNSCIEKNEIKKHVFYIQK